MCNHEMFAGNQVEKFLRVDRPLFVNVSNHPSSKWSEEQRVAALTYLTDDSEAHIVDIPFPNVPVEATDMDVWNLAHSVISEIEALARQYEGGIAVLVQGEMVLTYRLVALMHDYDTFIEKVVSTVSERVVSESLLPDGSTQKISTFAFKGFRPYF